MEEARLKPVFPDALAQARFGGSWDLHYINAERFMRDRNFPLAQFNHLSFRLVRDAGRR
jgi:hypothetical protein